MRLTGLVLAASLLPASAHIARAVGSSPEDLVLVQSGTLPIIFTAPHGGRAEVPGVGVRKIEGKPWPHYNNGGDTNTDLMIQAVAREINRLTGSDAYIVMAKFQRRFIDANRPPEVAFDNPGAEPAYRYYHKMIRHFVDEVRQRYPAGLLIDVHGQAKFPDHLIRGTINGRTVSKLIARDGQTAITGPKGLFGQLEINGFVVFPANDVPIGGTSEDAGFNGGFTLGQYGSHRPNGVDAVLFEFGVKHRRTIEVEAWAKRAAISIIAFYDTYLKVSGK